MVSADVALMLYIIPMVFGAILISPLGPSLANPLAEKFSSFSTKRGRLISGMKIIALAGGAVSTHTLYISQKVSEGAGYCASNGVFDCDSVIGNAAYNSDPVFGLPWGFIGIGAFVFFMWILMSIEGEPAAPVNQTLLRVGFGASLAGLLVIALLVYYEIQMGKICQFCTTAHVGNVLMIFGFFQLSKMWEENTWNE